MKSVFTSFLLCAFAMGIASSCTSENKEQTEQPLASETTSLPVYHIPFSRTSTIKKEHKNVLVISASPRKGGNTDLLCDEFIKGAQEAGGRVEKIFLDDYKITFSMRNMPQILTPS